MRKWWPLVAVCLGAFMLLVDVTIVTVALPDMAKDLSTSFSDLQWVMDMYALALAALLLGAGSLADLVGRRRIYVAGLGLFATASLVCGLAPDPALLIAARGVQGIGGAAMLATTMALLNSAYQGRDRGVAFGIWGAVNGAAAAGPILGGLLTEHFGWRWIFWVNLPVSVLAIVLTLRVVAESRNPRAEGVDVPGTASFTVAAAALTYALIRAGDEGWTDPAVLGLFALGAVALAVFVRVEQRRGHPMLDLGLLRKPSFVGVMLAALLLSATAFSYLPFSSLWLQSSLGLGPVKAGLALVPMCAAAFVVSALAGRFLHGTSPRWTIGGGLLLIAAGGFMQAVLDAGSGWRATVPGLIVTGLGVGIATPTLASAALATVPLERGGMAGGAVNTFRQLGNALGIAVLGAVFQNRMQHSLDGTPTGLRGNRRQLLRAAYASGLNGAFVLAGCLGLLGALIALLLVRRTETAAAPRETFPRGAAAGSR